MKDNQIFKLLSIIGFIIVVISCLQILVFRLPLKYFFSIYNALPMSFWISLSTIFLLGQIILIFLVYCNENKRFFYIGGFLLIIISDIILLFLPILLGFSGNDTEDVFSHMGKIRDIFETGQFGSNIYPADHIIAIILIYVSGLELSLITMIIPPVFSLFFILSFAVLTRVIFFERNEIIFALLFSSILLYCGYQTGFTPNSQSFFLTPFFLYVVYKLFINNKFFLLAMILGLSLIIFHPLVSLMMICIIILFQVSIKLDYKNFKDNRTLKTLVTLTLFLGLVYFIWSTYFSILVENIAPLVNIINEITPLQETQYSKYINLANKVDADFFYLISLTLKKYGQFIILGVYTIICAFILLYYNKFDFEKFRQQNIIFVLGFSIFSIISIIMLLFIQDYGFTRIFNFATVFAILLIAVTTNKIINELNQQKSLKKFKILFFCFLIMILFFVTLISINNMYLSPSIKAPSTQSTENNYKGVEVFFKYREKSYPISELGLSLSRYYDALYGREISINQRENIRYGASLTPIDHFGYLKTKSLGNIKNTNYYLIINEKGRHFYPEIYPEFKQFWRYTDNDFVRLELDLAVDKIFNNNDLTIYLIT